MSDAPTELLTEEATTEPVKTKKQVNPIVALVLIVVVLGAVYFLYQNATKDKIFYIGPKHSKS
jgi:hypothetical protein